MNVPYSHTGSFWYRLCTCAVVELAGPQFLKSFPLRISLKMSFKPGHDELDEFSLRTGEVVFPFS